MGTVSLRNVRLRLGAFPHGKKGATKSLHDVRGGVSFIPRELTEIAGTGALVLQTPVGTLKVASVFGGTSLDRGSYAPPPAAARGSSRRGKRERELGGSGPGRVERSRERKYDRCHITRGGAADGAKPLARGKKRSVGEGGKQVRRNQKKRLTVAGEGARRYEQKSRSSARPQAQEHGLRDTGASPGRKREKDTTACVEKGSTRGSG